VSVNPNTGQQGQQNLSVTITGQATHFSQGTTVANFGSGVQVQSLTVGSPTAATAVLNINPVPNAGIKLNFFPNTVYNANTAAMDTALGTTGYTIDSFETTALIPGLTIQLSGGVPTTTWTSLPNLFNGNTACPGQTSGQAWDGTDTASNQILNQITSCSSSPGVANLTTFNYAPGATSFGIGLSNFQSVNPPSPSFPVTNHELFVNGVDMGVLETLAGAAWSPGLTRNAYLRIDGTNGGVITTIAIANLSAAQGLDFLMFDHLAILPSATSAARDVTMTTNTEVATLTNGFTVNTNPLPLTITTTALPGGTVGTPYNAGIVSTGGVVPVVFTVTNGALPNGLSLLPSGALTGTPISAATFNFTIAATDSSTPPQTASQAYTVTIAPLVISSLAVQPSSPTILVGGVQQFIAVATLPNGSTQNLTTSVTWSSSDTTVATISNAPGNQGFATGVSVGTVTITADLNGVAGSAVLSVVSSSTATQFAYVANQSDNTISAYTLNSTNGALTQISGSPIPAGIAAPKEFAVDPTARFLYVSPNGGSFFSGLVINGATGSLTQVPGSPFPQSSSNTFFVTEDPTGRFVYRLSGSTSISIFSVDPNTGALAPITSLSVGSGLRAMAIDPKGRFAYVAECVFGCGNGPASVIALAIDPVTGGLTPLPGAPLPTGSNPFAITVDPTGTFAYVVNYGSGGGISAFTIDPNSGTLSAVPGSPFLAGSPDGLTVDRSGKFLYVTDGGSSVVYAFTINRTSGALTTVTGSPFQVGPNSFTSSVAVDATNQFVYVSDAGTHVAGFSINATTGALSSIGTFAAGNGAVFVTTVQTSGAQAMNLATDGPLLAINRSFNATVTLTQPVPTGSSVTVSLAANPSGVVSISPTTQTIQAGQTTAVFALTAGATAGSVVLTATATGFNNATAPLIVTSNAISFGTIPVLAPGQSGSLPVSLSFAAPAGGLTINFSSANMSVATITSSVFVPAGLLIPAANPQIAGVAIGATQITATAVGFAPDTGAVTVTVTASLNPSSISVNATRTANVTLTISAPAPVGGITFNLSSDNPAAATVPATVTVPKGQLSATFAVTGVAQGSANLTVSSPGITTITAPISVGAVPAISVSAPVIGNNLVAQGSISLGDVALSGSTNPTLTLTSSDSTHFLLTADPAKVGTPSITLPLTPGSNNVPAFYVEGLNFSGPNAITATLTATSSGFTTGTTSMTLYPTGLTYWPGVGTGGTLSTTTFSPPSTLTIYLALLTPGTLTAYNYGYPLGPQAPGAVPVTVTSTNTNVGTLTGSPATIGVGAYYTQAVSFVPAAAGATSLNVTMPAGYSIPSNVPVQLPVTVSAPAINLSTPVIGNNLVEQGNISLAAAVPSTSTNPTLTVTSGDSVHFLLTTDPAKVGTPSITLPLTPGSTNVPTFYVEGQSFSGSNAITATLTATSSGYATSTTTMALYPTGLTYWPGAGNGATLNTTTFSPPSTLTVYLVLLTPGTLTAFNYGYPLGPQAPGAVPVTVTSTSTNVGTLTGSPASIGVGTYYTQAVSFVPAAAGATSLNVTMPAGYSIPSNVPVQLPATVSAPAINLSTPVIGNNLVEQGNIGLAAAVPSTSTNPTLTLTSSDSVHFLLTANPATVGTPSITLPLTPGSANVPAFYVEGQNFSGSNAITATLTATSSGYATSTITLTLYPTGITYWPAIGTGSTLNTTTFSPPSTLTVYLVLLTPGTLTAYNFGYPLGPQAPGIVPVTVTSTNTSVGTLTGNPSSIGVGTYFTQAISFVPATAGTTNLNLTMPGGYSIPSNVPVQLPVTVSAPGINLSAPIIGNNLVEQASTSLGAAPPSNEMLTLTSSDPAHFLLTTDPAQVGSTQIKLQLTGGSSNVPAFYVEGQNFSGIGAITATLTASAAGYTDGTITLTLYPTGLSYWPGNNGSLTTTTSSPPSTLTVYLVLLNPGTLNGYNFGYALGPQAPGVVPVAVTSTNTSVGTVTGSPSSIVVGAYYTQAISFVPATTGTTNLNLATPAGYSTPSNVATQIVATVQ
jgi:6-phosphogluconolactonase (cycloisomerase 2 family)